MKILFTYSNYNQRYSSSSVAFQSKTSNIPTEHILELINSGKSVKVIKAELGIATDTYYRLLEERGIPFKRLKPKSKPSADLKTQISDMLSQGLLVPEICKRLKLTAYKYYSLVKQLGIQNPKAVRAANAAKITEKQLREKINAGLSVKEICESLGIAEKAYYSLLKKFNIQTANKIATAHNASIKKEQFVELLQAGKSMKEITKILGISDAAYIYFISKFGIVTKSKLAKQNISAITKECLQELIDKGLPSKEICEILNIPVRTYSRLLDKFGIITERKASKAHIASIQASDLQAAVDAGLKADEICKLFKTNKTAFYKLLKRLNIRYDYQHHNGEVLIPRDELVELASSDKTVNEIADELGVAATTYHEKAKLAQVKTVLRDSINTVNSIPKARIQGLINEGKSVDEICEELGITRANYITLLRKHNLQTLARKFQANISTITKEQLIELRKSGKTAAQICEELKISEHTFRRIMAANSDAL